MTQNEMHQVKTGNPEKFGVTVYAEGVNFTVEVPKDQEVSLLLFEKKSNEIQKILFPDDCRIGDVASIFVEKLSYKKYEYAYCIDGEVVLDPYAKVINNVRCGFVPGTVWIPEEETKWISFEEMILYKMHVRGFTKLAGKSIVKKGTFCGVEEAIPYLKELGINTIEFMPMYEWSENLREKKTSIYSAAADNRQEIKNYWGYALQNYYFAPKSRYASSKDPIGECRHMIQALHQAGIECVMEFYFPKGINPSLAMEALLYWKLYYGIDGFHLIGDGVPTELVVRSPYFKKTKLFLDRVDDEWIYGRSEPACRNIAEYNYDFMGCGRRFLKGDEGQVQNFIYQIRKNFKKHGVVNYMANHDGFTLNDMVSYNEKHNEDNGEENRDGMPANDVWNCGEEGPTDKASINAFRLKQMKNAMAYTLLAQGIPLIYQGDEFGNSQCGNNNAYSMDNEIGWVNWKLSKNGKELLEFVKKLIAFRKEHPIIHMEKPLVMSDYIECGYPDLSYHNEDAWYPKLDHKSHHIGCMYCNIYAKNTDEQLDKFLYVAYNTNWNIQKFALPKLPDHMKWKVAIQTEVPEKSNLQEGEILSDQKTLIVTPRCVVVLTANQLKENE